MLRIASLALMLAGLLAATRAWAAFVPLDNQSMVYSKSTLGEQTDEVTNQAAGAFFWDGLAISEVKPGGPGWASADFTVATGSIEDSCMYAVGEGSASAFGGGVNTGRGEARLLFVINQTQEYQAILHVDPHQLPETEHYIELLDPRMAVYWRHESGGTLIAGRMAPGAYWLLGKTGYPETSEGGRSWSFAAHICITHCTPVIGQQPTDQTVPPGATIGLQLGLASSPQSSPADAQGTTSYQWRKNLQDLANGGRISGVDAPNLVITNAAFADSGFYDCVVTQGTIVEPSRQAHVVVADPLAVELPLAASEVHLAAPRPNPFRDATRFEFGLSRPARVSLTVYDALGRRVKTLLPSTPMAPGSFAIDWNGTNANGGRVPSGMYFVHLAAGGTRLVQRAVLVAR